MAGPSRSAFEIKSKNKMETINNKNILSFQEAVAYTGFSSSYLYKLTCNRQIPHSKPHGKLIFFDRLELEGWLMRNRVATSGEIQDEAKVYCKKARG